MFNHNVSFSELIIILLYFDISITSIIVKENSEHDYSLNFKYEGNPIITPYTIKALIL